MHMELESTLVVLYQIWLSRNDAMDSKQIDEPYNIANRLLEEWCNIQDQPAPKPEEPKECWSPLAINWYKLNVDATLAKSSRKGGGGVVIHDHDGSYIAGSFHFFPSL
jgi:hypothetical protein